MVKIFFIPPMGHSKSFYKYIKKTECMVFLDYPYNQETVDQENSLDYLAQYFAKTVTKHMAESQKYSDIVLVGVSLGATLSLKINQLLENRVKKLVLIAPSGLKVARARKEMIKHAINNLAQEEFIKKALGLEQQANFLDHFSDKKENAKEYYPIISSFWSDKYEKTQGTSFKKMAIDALEVNYEELLVEYQDKIHLLWGKKDKIFSMRHFNKFNKLLNHAELDLHDQVGHYLPIEAPQHLDKLMDNYVFNI